MNRRSQQAPIPARPWWSQRFTDVLESYGLGGRMERGQRYARSGRVLSLEVSTGVLEAAVQGSERRPYRVQVRSNPPDDKQWRQLEEQLSRRLGWTAQLLTGALPREMEQACREVGINLLPERWRDLNCRCSCPDGMVPCKHIAAVLYVFAARLDEDPWLLLRWRGRQRDQLLNQLRPAPPQGLSHLPPWWPEGLRAQPQQRLWMPEAAPPAEATAALQQLGPLADSTSESSDLERVLAPAYRLLISDERNSADPDDQSVDDQPADEHLRSLQ